MLLGELRTWQMVGDVLIQANGPKQQKTIDGDIKSNTQTVTADGALRLHVNAHYLLSVCQHNSSLLEFGITYYLKHGSAHSSK